MVNYMAAPGCTKIKTLESEEVNEHIIFNNVCRAFGYPNPDLVIKNNKLQKREYVIIRQVTMTLLVLKLNFTLQKAGEFFGDKDHTTTMWAIKTVQNLRDTDKNFRDTISHLFQGVVFREKRPYKRNQNKM